MADELTNLTDLQSHLMWSFSSEDRALEEVEHLDHSLDSLEAIDQYAVRVALDACTLLGGVELLTWPASLEFAGTWLMESKCNLAEVPVSYISQCWARDLESGGFPVGLNPLSVTIAIWRQQNLHCRQVITKLSVITRAGCNNALQQKFKWCTYQLLCKPSFCPFLTALCPCLNAGMP